MDRREFFRQSALAGTGSLLLGSSSAKARPPSKNETVKFACIGVGGKGESDTDDAGSHGEIVALCDIDSHVLDKMGKSTPGRKSTTTIEKCSRTSETRSTP